MSGGKFSRQYSIVAEMRRRWTGAEKEAIIAEAAKPGVNISAVARRHGIKPRLSFRWRRLAREDKVHANGSAFVPVTLALPPAGVRVQLQKRLPRFPQPHRRPIQLVERQDAAPAIASKSSLAMDGLSSAASFTNSAWRMAGLRRKMRRVWTSQAYNGACGRNWTECAELKAGEGAKVGEIIAFTPLVYSAGMLLPAIDLGQRAA